MRFLEGRYIQQEYFFFLPLPPPISSPFSTLIVHVLINFGACKLGNSLVPVLDGTWTLIHLFKPPSPTPPPPPGEWLARVTLLTTASCVLHPTHKYNNLSISVDASLRPTTSQPLWMKTTTSDVSWTPTAAHSKSAGWEESMPSFSFFLQLLICMEIEPRKSTERSKDSWAWR